METGSGYPVLLLLNADMKSQTTCLETKIVDSLMAHGLIDNLQGHELTLWFTLSVGGGGTCVHHKFDSADKDKGHKIK